MTVINIIKTTPNVNSINKRNAKFLNRKRANNSILIEEEVNVSSINKRNTTFIEEVNSTAIFKVSSPKILKGMTLFKVRKRNNNSILIEEEEAKAEDLDSIFMFNEYLKIRDRQQQAEHTQKIQAGLLNGFGIVPTTKPKEFLEFENFVESECLEIEEKEEDKTISELLKDKVVKYIVEEFFLLIPKIHLPFVLWKVEKQFNGSKEKFIEKHHLFLSHFDIEKRRLCDNSYILDRETKRNLRKLIKSYILHSAQLLGLVGKGGKSYVTDSMLELYKEDIENQEAYLTNFRLITKKGKFLRLQTVEAKQRKRNAQILNLSSCLAKMAEEKKFTWCMITLTLPPSFHPAPSIGANSYNGVDPLTAHKQINSYWKKIRALLAKAGLKAGHSYFGCSVHEVMKDSTLHKHSLIYIDESHVDLLKNIVNGVAARSSEFVRFDIVENGVRKIKDKKTGKITYLQVPKVQGATYIYKYIMKFNGTYTDDNTLRNQSARYFYSARGFDFFGLKSSLSKFNFLLANYGNYKEFFNEELREIFEKFNYYEFQKNYEQYFKIVRNHKGAILFVEYDLNGNRDIELRQNKIMSNITNQKVIIKKKLFSVFEITEEIREKEIEDIGNIDIENIKNAGVKSAFQSVIKMEDDYSSFISQYVIDNAQFQYIKSRSELNIEDNNFLIEESIRRRIEKSKNKDNFSMLMDDIKKQENNLKAFMVTVDQSCSRKSRKRSATQLEVLEKYFYIPDKEHA